jgi:hypothetical protein
MGPELHTTDRRPGGGKRVSDQPGSRLQALLQRPGQAGAGGGEAAQAAQHAARAADPAADLVRRQLPRAGLRPGLEGPGLRHGSIGSGSEQELHQVHAAAAVDHAVVHLRHHREVLAAFDALDDPHLPQWPRVVQRLTHDPAGDVLELFVAAGGRRGQVSEVVPQVEVGGVHPDRVLLQRRVGQLLPVARDLMQDPLDRRAEGLQVDTARRAAQRLQLVQAEAGDVHGRVLVLHDEELAIHRTQRLEAALASGFGHREAPPAATGTCALAANLSHLPAARVSSLPDAGGWRVLSRRRRR